MTPTNKKIVTITLDLTDASSPDRETVIKEMRHVWQSYYGVEEVEVEKSWDDDDE